MDPSNSGHTDTTATQRTIDSTFNDDLSRPFKFVGVRLHELWSSSSPSVPSASPHHWQNTAVAATLRFDAAQLRALAKVTQCRSTWPTLHATIHASGAVDVDSRNQHASFSCSRVDRARMTRSRRDWADCMPGWRRSRHRVGSGAPDADVDDQGRQVCIGQRLRYDQHYRWAYAAPCAPTRRRQLISGLATRSTQGVVEKTLFFFSIPPPPPPPLQQLLE